MIWESDKDINFYDYVREIKYMCEVISIPIELEGCPVCKNKFKIKFMIKNGFFNGSIGCVKCDYVMGMTYWMDKRYKEDIPYVLESTFSKLEIYKNIAKYFGDKYFQFKNRYELVMDTMKELFKEEEN